jgi:lipoate-protein ligase A
MKVKSGILKGEFKVKNGKLIKCVLEIKDGRIKSIKFTGDFFMHPEEKIEELEERLKDVEFDKEKLEKLIFEFFEEVEIIGASGEDFVEVIMRAR